MRRFLASAFAAFLAASPALALELSTPPGSGGGGGGGVSSVGLNLPGSFTCSGSPVTSSGTITCSYTSETAGTFFAAPSGASGTPSFRALVGADLPLPTASTLGGVESSASVAHQWLASIDTSGVPHLSQPGFSDLSGSIALSQIPNSGVTAGSYTCSADTVDAEGLVTAASSGSCSGGGGVSSVGLALPSFFFRLRFAGHEQRHADGQLGERNREHHLRRAQRVERHAVLPGAGGRRPAGADDFDARRRRSDQRRLA
ncbi:MAG TPA: hypothetical protein VN832_01355 [Stellaceae bacterium]|nr:hypothetical protein [Stellaceae bacterium]